MRRKLPSLLGVFRELGPIFRHPQPRLRVQPANRLLPFESALHLSWSWQDGPSAEPHLFCRHIRRQGSKTQFRRNDWEGGPCSLGGVGLVGHHERLLQQWIAGKVERRRWKDARRAARLGPSRWRSSPASIAAMDAERALRLTHRLTTRAGRGPCWRVFRCLWPAAAMKWMR